MEKTQKEELIRSAVRSAVFAVVFGLIISCSHNTNLVTPPTNVTGLRQLVSHITPTMIGFPANLKGGQPLLATFFQTAPQTSQIQQSFEGLSCGAFQPGSEVNFSHTASGFIPIQVLGDPFIEPGDPSAVEKMACGGVFAQVGGGTDISIPLPPAPPPTKPGTLTNPGTARFRR